jgi:protein-tyrosine phosphatase
MIDIHCHILPGIDDGPKNMEESSDLARMFVREGYTQVIATPHWALGTSWMPSKEEVSKVVEELNRVLKDKGIELTVHSGMEIALDNRIPELLEGNEVIGLANTSYVLVELPFFRLPLGWETILFNIMSLGYRVIVCHPERCVHLFQDKGIIDEFINAGLFLQVNWASFLGHYGHEAEQMANYMASKGYIHCLASDSHDLRERHPGHVKNAMKLVENLTGTDNLRLVAEENPERLLAGDQLVAMSRSGTSGKAGKNRKWLFF